MLAGDLPQPAEDSWLGKQVNKNGRSKIPCEPVVATAHYARTEYGTSKNDC